MSWPRPTTARSGEETVGCTSGRRAGNMKWTNLISQSSTASTGRFTPPPVCDICLPQVPILLQ
jgi:hypothetical protein